MIEPRVLRRMVDAIQRLAKTPFDESSIRSTVDAQGWTIDMEGWTHRTGRDFEFSIRDPEAPQRIVVVEREKMIAVALRALMLGERSPGEGCITSFAEMREGFDQSLSFLRGSWGEPDWIGRYASPHLEAELAYSGWRWPGGVALLLEHDEGDGHLGNDATLDLRFLAGRSSLPDFPLETDVLL